MNTQSTYQSAFQQFLTSKQAAQEAVSEAGSETSQLGSPTESPKGNYIVKFFLIQTELYQKISFITNLSKNQLFITVKHFLTNIKDSQ